MQNIGERLEEARKRQGVSIREAAEATKIRGEFLLAFENNSMDIPLPEVYVRGFLINYSKFLKLDSDKILTDYSAMMLSQGKTAKKDTREYLGRMDLPEQDFNEAGTPETGSSRPDSHPTPDRALYYKVVLVVGAAVLFICAVILIVNLMVTSGSEVPEINPELQLETPGATAPQIPSGSIEEITLVALDDVAVTITQLNDNTRLFTGTLAKGDTETISKIGRVRIFFSEGDHLVVEKNGQRIKMPQSSVGALILE